MKTWDYLLVYKEKPKINLGDIIEDPFRGDCVVMSIDAMFNRLITSDNRTYICMHQYGSSNYIIQYIINVK